MSSNSITKSTSYQIFSSEIIPVHKSDSGELVVFGREIHEALESGTPYDKWFPRMAEYGFEEGKDFSTFLSESTGGRPATDHAISFDMAKHIAMIQRTEKGKEIRQKLIDLEKNQHQPKPMTQLEVLAAVTKNLVEQDRRLNMVEAKQTAMIDAFMAPAMMDWANDMNHRINHICKEYGKNYQKYRGELYATLESTAHCNLTSRKTRLQERMKQSGHKYRDIHEVTKIQVIADDPKLRAIFEGIIRTEQMKYVGGEAS